MEDLVLKLITFLTNFDAPVYFSQDRHLLQYFGFMILACLCSRDYMSSIYDLKKSDEKKKYIRKEYPMYQRILLIHWYQNIYKKVDRFWFDVAFWGYLSHILLFLIVMALTLSARYAPLLHVVAGTIYGVHVVLIVVTILLDLLAFLVFSSNPGREYPDEKKYKKKNW